MQNRSAIWVFTILLAIAALYSLSFSFFTNQYENERDVYIEEQVATDKLSNKTLQERKDAFEKEYDTKYGNEPLVPLLGTTYYGAKDKELKKGLDLEGGFSAVLELNISELVNNIAGNTDEDFQRVLERARELQNISEDDFVTLFESAWNEIQPFILRIEKMFFQLI